MALRVQTIEPGGVLHVRALALRFELLRAPLGMARGSEWFDHEEDCVHVVALDDDGVVVGCVLYHPGPDAGGRLLQMAVHPTCEGRGWGRRLVEHLEDEVVARGHRTIHLHSRDTAIGFYRKLGYECVGEPYVEVGIPHQSMRKTLDGAD